MLERFRDSEKQQQCQFRAQDPCPNCPPKGSTFPLVLSHGSRKWPRSICSEILRGASLLFKSVTMMKKPTKYCTSTIRGRTVSSRWSTCMTPSAGNHVPQSVSARRRGACSVAYCAAKEGPMILTGLGDGPQAQSAPRVLARRSGGRRRDVLPFLVPPPLGHAHGR